MKSLVVVMDPRNIFNASFDCILQVGIREINYDQFFDLLTELFLGDGVTRERILVLFFFCSDLAIRTLKQQAVNIFQRCLEWSQRYIIERVCLWVQEQGGWVGISCTSNNFIYLFFFCGNRRSLLYWDHCTTNLEPPMLRVATAQGKQGIWLLTFPDRENTGNLVNLIFYTGEIVATQEKF